MLTVGIITAQLLGVSYGWYAVACPLLMINLKGSGDRMWWIGWIVTNVIYTITCNSAIQIFTIFTPLILAYHNRTKNRKPTEIEKKLFYYFYPIHLAGLATLRTILWNERLKYRIWCQSSRPCIGSRCLNLSVSPSNHLLRFQQHQILRSKL